MLDAPAPRAVGLGSNNVGGALVAIERHAHRAIADGVGVDLQVELGGACDHRVELGLGPVGTAGGVRSVLIRREHRGSVGFDHAVHDDLDGAGPKPHAGVLLRQRGHAIEHSGGIGRRDGNGAFDAQRQFALVEQFLVQRERSLIAACVLDAGDPQAGGHLLAFEQRCDFLIVRGRGYQTPDHRLRVFLEASGGLPLGVLDDFAVAGKFGRGIDVGAA